MRRRRSRPVPAYSRALLMSSAALSMRALRMLARGMDTCSEMDEKGGLSLSAAEQDIGHNSRQRDTIESTTTCVREAQMSHGVCCRVPTEAEKLHRDHDILFKSEHPASMSSRISGNRRRTCSSLSAALASSPAKVSSRCLTGPSTDSTWASSHRDGYSWRAQKDGGDNGPKLAIYVR